MAKKRITSRKRRSNAGKGVFFKFHGGFSRKEDAVAKEQSTPGAFIREKTVKGRRRYYVMSPRKDNPFKKKKKSAPPRVFVVKRHKPKRSKVKPMKKSKKRSIRRGGGKPKRRQNAGRSRKLKRAARQLMKRLVKRAKHKNAKTLLAKTRKGKSAKRRHNPNDDYSQAADLYKKFIGQDPEQLTEIVEKVYEEDQYAGLGLTAKIEGPWGFMEWDVDEEDEAPMLGSDPSGHQLYFLGGDQNAEKFVRTLPHADMKKKMVEVGPVRKITYFALKAMHNYEPTFYEHQFGEEGGKAPTLVYDVASKKLHLIGGTYFIKPEGIRD